MARPQDDEAGSAERILKAAERILAEEGYEALSMRKVGASVGLSQAAIYRHFKDKAELVERIVAKGYASLLSRLEVLDDPGGRPDELLALGFRAYVDFAATKPRLFKAVLLKDIGPAGRQIQALSPGVAGRRRTFEILTSLLRRGMEEGLFEKADPETTAQALWASLFGLAARVAIEAGAKGGGGMPPHFTAISERQIELLLRGLEGRRTRESTKESS